MTEKGVVNIHGKKYLTVAYRVNLFREEFKPGEGWSIRTWLISNEGDRVVIQASICDKDDHVVATGFAEEVRGSTNINKTSALENCETSAIGRALAAFGLGGEEYCSADELVSALQQQSETPKKKASEPSPSQAPPTEKKPKFNPRDRCIKWLERLEELVGEKDAVTRFTNLMKHSEYSENSLSLSGVNGFDNLRELGNEIKEMVQAIENTKEEE